MHPFFSSNGNSYAYTCTRGDVIIDYDTIYNIFVEIIQKLLKEQQEEPND